MRFHFDQVRRAKGARPKPTHLNLIAVRSGNDPARSRHDGETANQFSIGRLLKHDPACLHSRDPQMSIAPDQEVLLAEERVTGSAHHGPMPALHRTHVKSYTSDCLSGLTSGLL